MSDGFVSFASRHWIAWVHGMSTAPNHSVSQWKMKTSSLSSKILWSIYISQPLLQYPQSATNYKFPDSSPGSQFQHFDPEQFSWMLGYHWWLSLETNKLFPKHVSPTDWRPCGIWSSSWARSKWSWVSEERLMKASSSCNWLIILMMA